MEKTRLFCGIDVSSDTLDLCYCDETGTYRHMKVGNSLKGFREIKKAVGLQYHFVMEATGIYHLKLAFYLHEQKAVFSVVNSIQIKRFIQMHLERNKSDKKDAKRICDYGRERLPEPSELQDEAYYHCKILSGAIEGITSEMTVFKNKLHSLKKHPLKNPVTESSYKSILKQLEKEVEKLELELKARLKEWQPELLELVGSVTGIGKRATAELLVFTQGFRNMESYRQLISYAGLSPNEYTSGSSIRGKSRICKQGGKRIRNILYMCAMNAKRTNRSCRALFERLVAKGKNKKLALIAVCNKLLKQVFGVVKNRTTFVNNYQENYA